MKEIKLLILDWHNEPTEQNFWNNYFVKILQKHFKVTYSDQPDFVLYGPYGKEHLKYDCVRVFYTGENVRPDFNVCDYAISFDYINFLDRAFRFPLFAHDSYRNSLELTLKKHENIEEALAKKSKFCSFIVSNGAAAIPLRKEMFERLSRYKRVDSGGKYLNNIGYCVGDKIAFNKEYKFTICFENSISPGYLTEKIVDAFASQTVPIYYGDIATKDGYLARYGGGNWLPELNNKACVNLHNFESMEECVEQIIKIDSDIDLYAKMLGEKAFLRDEVGKIYNDGLEKFLLHIFSQDKEEASRRSYSYRVEEHVRSLTPTKIKRVKQEMLRLFGLLNR